MVVGPWRKRHLPAFTCHLAETTTPLSHTWEHTVGSGHATLALRADWQAQLRRCHDELGFRHVRFHGIFNDDMGSLVEQGGAWICSFFNADRIFDFLVSIGMRPFVELSFMPEALASGQKTVFHYRGNVTPPKDPGQWASLVQTFVGHCVDRYGIGEVREWFFEVWNEPNIPSCWSGNQKAYFELYAHSAKAVKSVDPALRVGGPATAKNEWIPEFLTYCRRHRAPVDFVSTHHYPGDALGDEGDDTGAQLAGNRRGSLREQAQDTFRRAEGLPVYYTEWNASSNPRDRCHDESYAAAYIVKTVLETNGLVEAYGFWTISDLFEENYFPSMPFHGGFGLLSLHGIAKPAYRAYQLLHALGTEQLLVDGIHVTVDAWAVRKGDTLTVLLTNHALPRHPIQSEKVTMVICGSAAPLAVSIERIDETHANPRQAWHEMGEPQYLDALALARLTSASCLQSEPLKWKHAQQSLRFELVLPVDGVAAVTIRYPAASRPMTP